MTSTYDVRENYRVVEGKFLLLLFLCQHPPLKGVLKYMAEAIISGRGGIRGNGSGSEEQTVLHCEIFTTNTEWKVPDSISGLNVFVRLFGGGGGGFPWMSGIEYGAGGGGGNMNFGEITVVKNQIIPITIGEGGSTDNNGGTTSFGEYLSATGGEHGYSENGGNGGTGGGAGSYCHNNRMYSSGAYGGIGYYGGGGGGGAISNRISGLVSGGSHSLRCHGGNGGMYGGGGGAGGRINTDYQEYVNGFGGIGGSFGGNGGNSAMKTYGNNGEVGTNTIGNNNVYQDPLNRNSYINGNGLAGFRGNYYSNSDYGSGSGGGGGYGGCGGNGGDCGPNAGGGGGGGGGYGASGGNARGQYSAAFSGGGGGGGWGDNGKDAYQGYGGGGGGYSGGYGAGGSRGNDGNNGICIIWYYITA